MAAVTLKDLLDLQRINAVKGDVNAQRQVERLESLEKIMKQDRVLQAAQVVEAARTEHDDERTADGVENLEAILKKGLVDKRGDGLNSNIIKMFEQIKKQNEQISELQAALSQQGPAPTPLEPTTPDAPKGKKPTSRALNKDETAGITQTAMARQQYPTIRERFTQMKENAFNVRNFLSATGIVQKGTGGILDTALAKREEKKEYIASRLKMDSTANLQGVRGAKQTFSRQFDEQQAIQSKIRQNEKTISKYERQGFTAAQIGLTGAFTERDKLATNLAKSDTRVRPVGFDARTGKVKELPDGEEVAKPLAKPVSKRSKAKPEQSAPEPVLSGLLAPSANPVGNAGAAEKENEASRQREEQVKLLKQIEENTRGGEPKKVGTTAEPSTSGMLGGMVESLMGGLVGNLGKAFKFLLNPRSLLKVLTKFALPAAIIGSVVNGVIDGFNVWKETGSISEALIAGVGGILEFLSFGLFDKETIRGIVDGVEGFYTDYIEKPVQEFVETITGVFTSVKTFFTDAINSFTGMIENIGIPKVGFKIPVIDKEVSIGPFYPFKSDTSGQAAATPASAVSAPPAQAAQQVYSQSGANAGAASAPAAAPAAAPVVINAPTNVNSSTTYAPRIPPRNSESSYQQYNRSRFA